MGIRFYCPGCGRRMNVKAFLAGRRGICPHCEARFEIPQASEIPKGAPRYRPSSGVSDAASSSSSATSAVGVAVDSPAMDAAEEPNDPIEESPDAVWYVRPPSGGEFGPAKGDVMRRWIDEGRVSGDALVWRDGWNDWATAADWFPELAPSNQVVGEPESSSPASPLVLTEKVQTSDRTRRRPARRSTSSVPSIAAIVTLGLLIVVLVGVLVVVVQQSG